MLFKAIFVLVVLAIFYHEFFVTEEYWSGVYYPGGNSFASSIYSPRFFTKEECIGWAINERGLRPSDAIVPLGDLWECNKNCKLDPAYTNLLHAPQQYKQELLKDNKGSLYDCDDGGFDGGNWLRGDF